MKNQNPNSKKGNILAALISAFVAFICIVLFLYFVGVPKGKEIYHNYTEKKKEQVTKGTEEQKKETTEEKITEQMDENTTEKIDIEDKTEKYFDSDTESKHKVVSASETERKVVAIWKEKPAGTEREAPFGIYTNGNGGYTCWNNVWDVKPAGTDPTGDICWFWEKGQEGKELWVCYIKDHFTTRNGNLEYSNVNEEGTYTVEFKASGFKSMEGGVVTITNSKNQEYFAHKMKAVGYNNRKDCGIMWADFIIKKDGDLTEWWCAHYFLGENKYGKKLWNESVPFWHKSKRKAPNWVDSKLDEEELRSK